MEVVVACVLNMSLMAVAELVAVVTTHPAVTVEVALAVFVTVRVAEPVPPPTVKFPDSAVELAAAFLIVSPERSVNWVVLAPPRKVARPVTLSVELNAPVVPETPTDELNAPVVFNAPEITVELADAFLIVSPERSVNWVVLAPPRKVARPVTLRVVENEPDVPDRAPTRVSAPAEPKVDVAVWPKYAVLAESIVELA